MKKQDIKIGAEYAVSDANSYRERWSARRAKVIEPAIVRNRIRSGSDKPGFKVAILDDETGEERFYKNGEPVVWIQPSRGFRETWEDYSAARAAERVRQDAIRKARDEAAARRAVKAKAILAAAEVKGIDLGHLGYGFLDGERASINISLDLLAELLDVKVGE